MQVMTGNKRQARSCKRGTSNGSIWLVEKPKGTVLNAMSSSQAIYIADTAFSRPETIGSICELLMKMSKLDNSRRGFLYNVEQIET